MASNSDQADVDILERWAKEEGGFELMNRPHPHVNWQDVWDGKVPWPGDEDDDTIKRARKALDDYQVAVGSEDVLKIDVGEHKSFAGVLFVRIKKTDGKWGDYKKLGKAPEGWQQGDELPKDMADAAKAALGSSSSSGEKEPDAPAAPAAKHTPHAQGWNPYANWTMDELTAERDKITSDPKNKNPEHEHGNSIYIYTKEANKKLDKIAYAITARLKEQKANDAATSTAEGESKGGKAAPGGKETAPSGGAAPESAAALPAAGKAAVEHLEKHAGWKLTLHEKNESIGPFLAKFGADYVKEYPFLRGFIDAIGDPSGVMPIIGGKENLGGGTMAAVHYGKGFDPGKMGLSINFKGYSSDPNKWEKMAESGIASGFHPKGTASLKATIDHEMGHVITKVLHTRDPELKKLWESVGGHEKGPASQSKCREVLSGYAAVNIGEFVAEGWSEYRNNPEPRPMAVKIGKRMDELLRKKHALIESLAKTPEDKKKMWALSIDDLKGGA